MDRTNGDSTLTSCGKAHAQAGRGCRVYDEVRIAKSHRWQSDKRNCLVRLLDGDAFGVVATRMICVARIRRGRSAAIFTGYIRAVAAVSDRDGAREVSRSG